MARILIVDDEEALRATMRRMLQTAGHEVIEAGDGEQALGLAARNPPDLAVCDIYMPVREGFETIRELRQGFPKLGVIAVSGAGGMNPSVDFLRMAGLLGADATLAKPFVTRQLLALVETVLAKHADTPEGTPLPDGC